MVDPVSEETLSRMDRLIEKDLPEDSYDSSLGIRDLMIHGWVLAPSLRWTPEPPGFNIQHYSRNMTTSKDMIVNSGRAGS